MTIITKASGDRVPFDVSRLRRSLERVGANPVLIKDITHHISNILTEGMSTHEIYRTAFKMLRKYSKTIAAKYHLKHAIMQLGQSGFPFEKYIAAILRHQGFDAINNQIIQGHCVSHEVDVVAKRDHQILFVECKYHNRLGLKCDVKIPLYFKARFDDITQAYPHGPKDTLLGWLVTNTRFSQDAIQYGRCVGLYLVSWDYPDHGNLKELIESSGLYPITCISSFTKAEISALLEQNIILCKDISHNFSILHPLNIPNTRRKTIIEQCRALTRAWMHTID